MLATSATMVFLIAALLFLMLCAAPSPTARATPSGIKLKDGFSSLVTFAADTNIELWEKTVKPPDVDGGDAIEQTTMHNDLWRTMAPRQLLTLTESSFAFAYDPACYTAIIALINVETTITKTFSDGSTLAFYGYLRMVEFDDLTEGEQPSGTASITPTNWDFTNKVEAGPTVTSVGGT